MNIEIVKAKKKFFKEIAKLHISGIIEGFLSTLGVTFLSQLYKGISDAPNSEVYVAVSDNMVVGFISYTKDVKACYKNVLKSNWFSLSMALMPNLFRLSIYKKVIETLSYPNKQQKKDNLMESIHPELLSIAVNEKCRGKCVGKLLVKSLEAEFLKMDITKYYVVTHAVDTQSNAFYLSCGFTLCREFVNHDKPMNEYMKNISLV